MKRYRLFFYVIIILVLLAGCKKVEENIIISAKAGAPVSPAEITLMEFTANSSTEADWLEDSVSGIDILYACCRVEGIDDAATSVQVYWTLPDGSSTPAESIAINRDMDFFAGQDIMDKGEYTVHCALYGQDEVSKTLLVH